MFAGVPSTVNPKPQVHKIPEMFFLSKKITRMEGLASLRPKPYYLGDDREFRNYFCRVRHEFSSFTYMSNARGNLRVLVEVQDLADFPPSPRIPELEAEEVEAEEVDGMGYEESSHQEYTEPYSDLGTSEHKESVEDHQEELEQHAEGTLKVLVFDDHSKKMIRLGNAPLKGFPKVPVWVGLLGDRKDLLLVTQLNYQDTNKGVFAFLEIHKNTFSELEFSFSLNELIPTLDPQIVKSKLLIVLSWKPVALVGIFPYGENLSMTPLLKFQTTPRLMKTISMAGGDLKFVLLLVGATISVYHSNENMSKLKLVAQRDLAIQESWLSGLVVNNRLFVCFANSGCLWINSIRFELREI